MKVIEAPKNMMILICPFGHEWKGTYGCYDDGERTGFRRRRVQFRHEYAPSHCPTCGHRCAGGKPE